MSSGFERSQKRREILSRFAKDLVRRSSSRCELCDASGTPLSVYEVPPPGEIPEYEHCVFLCDACRERTDRFPGDDVQAWRVLEKSAWSDVPAVQVLAIRILRRLADEHPWASRLLDTIVIEPEILSRADLES